MTAFVEMRKLILNNAGLFQRLDKMEVKQIEAEYQELYHLGASLKDLGKKWFAFSKMDSLTSDVLNKLNR